MPPHGIYPAQYYKYELPDLEVGSAGKEVYNYNIDFDQNNPGTPALGDYQIYNIDYDGYFWLHMDVSGTAWRFDGDKSKSWARVSPYSHDADAPQIPEPTTMLLLSTGLIGLAGFRKKLSKK